MRPSGRSAATKIDPSPRAPSWRLRLLVKEDDRRAEGAAFETLWAGAVQGAVVGGDDVRVLARDHVARPVVQTGRPQRSGTNASEARHAGDALRISLESGELACPARIDLADVGERPRARRITTELAGDIELRRSGQWHGRQARRNGERPRWRRRGAAPCAHRSRRR